MPATFVPPPDENVLAGSAGLTSLVSEIGRALPPLRPIKEDLSAVQGEHDGAGTAFGSASDVGVPDDALLAEAFLLLQLQRDGRGVHFVAPCVEMIIVLPVASIFVAAVRILNFAKLN